MNAAADSPGKRAAILEAAKKVFLEVGFGAASMDAIATEAKVSKQTVYNHFGSKEELFAAMVRDSCEHLTLALTEAAKDGNPEKTLRAIARRFMEMVFSDDKLAMHRILMAEVPRFPELGRIFYQSGPAVIRQSVADYFKEQDKRGTLKVANPRITAEQFISMVTACRLRSDLGVEAAPSVEVREQYIDNAVSLILRACKP
ncbi:MAG: TetR/AcrR family transcriptional regulator [Gammaproteobacteria bacterium]|nr:TetR/AcrR family transcriptional regulator [Gammaproteobacteria bacterium]MBU6510417.1 TetR/AcrR family transcriptional regulator [Gammaproteobacteria bacterium]MDE1984182.1 TetR/AcrR family transcriptional regulator [Gammaproteobacteria bacterium]